MSAPIGVERNPTAKSGPIVDPTRLNVSAVCRGFPRPSFTMAPPKLPPRPTLMLNPLRLLLATAVILPLAAESFAAADPENTLYLDLKDGRVVIEMRPDLAPKHVARIKELTRKGFYNGLVFHRVIDGFMAQTGDPQGTGMGGSGVQLPSVFSLKPLHRGAVAMTLAA